MEQRVSFITVAAANTNESIKNSADLVCTGKNDELTIQKAIERAVKEEKNLYLFNGIYHIDAFYDFKDGGPKTAVCVPNNHREFSIYGQNFEYGFQKRYDNGVVLYVSDEALCSINGTADVIRSNWCATGLQCGNALDINKLVIILDNNQHPIRCIDLRRTDRVEVKNVAIYGYGNQINEASSVPLEAYPDVPAKGCIGITMTDGSNYMFSNYTNVQVFAFDECIQVGGEHVVCINCGAALGNYGWTFGNYEFNYGSNHPITLINCLDEHNINMPLFNKCGDNGGAIAGNQEVTMVGFNLERVEGKAPGGKKYGDKMKEVSPGTWKGNIGFTLQPAWGATNSVDCQIWENDGSGKGIITRNNCHKTVCDTKERLSYYPTYGQQIFDTDLNKTVICTDSENKIWVDFNGNKVD